MLEREREHAKQRAQSQQQQQQLRTQTTRRTNYIDEEEERAENFVKASSKPNWEKEFAQDSAGNNNEQKKREMGREGERRGRRGRGERWWATAREQEQEQQ